MDDPLSKAERDGLGTVEWAMKHFGSAGTGRAFRLRTARLLEQKGLIRDIGLVYRCDDYGDIRWNARMVTGWQLTEAGIKALGRIRGEEVG